MQHDPIRQSSFGALYTVPEDEEESDEEAGSAVRSPVADPGDWRHSFSDAAGAQSKQDPATGPVRASGRCDDSATGSPASSEETPWSAMPSGSRSAKGGAVPRSTATTREKHLAECAEISELLSQARADETRSQLMADLGR